MTGKEGIRPPGLTGPVEWWKWFVRVEVTPEDLPHLRIRLASPYEAKLFRRYLGCGGYLRGQRLFITGRAIVEAARVLGLPEAVIDELARCQELKKPGKTTQPPDYEKRQDYINRLTTAVRESLGMTPLSG